MIIFIDGPESIKRFLFIEIDWHNYCGPQFFIFGKGVYPGRFSPLWIICKLMYRDKFRRKQGGQ